MPLIFTKLESVLRAVFFSVFSRYEELRYWYDCLFYEEELRQYHDYIAAMEEIENRQYHEVCFPTCYSFYKLGIFLNTVQLLFLFSLLLICFINAAFYIYVYDNFI